MLRTDVEFLRTRYTIDVKGEAEGRLVLRSVISCNPSLTLPNPYFFTSCSNEASSNVYTTEVITKILKEEGDPLFDSRSAALGHTLQGGIPSPTDRARAVRLSMKCMTFIESQASALKALPEKKRKASGDSAAVITIQGSSIALTPVQEVVKHADMKNRRGIDPWWEGLKDLAEVLGGRQELARV